MSHPFVRWLHEITRDRYSVDDGELQEWERTYLDRKFATLTNHITHELERTRRYTEELDSHILVQTAKLEEKVLSRLFEQDALLHKTLNDHANRLDNILLQAFRDIYHTEEAQKEAKLLLSFFAELDAKLDEIIRLAEIRRRRGSTGKKETLDEEVNLAHGNVIVGEEPDAEVATAVYRIHPGDVLEMESIL